MKAKAVLSISFALGAALTLTAIEGATAQPKSAPPFQIRGCTTYLQLMEAQQTALNRDEALLRFLKEKRSLAGQSRSPSSPTSTPEQSASEHIAGVDYDVEIGKLAYMTENGRKFLTSLDLAYHVCIKTPPRRAR